MKTVIDIGDSVAPTRATTLDSEFEPCLLRNAFEDAPIGIALVSVACLTVIGSL